MKKKQDLIYIKNMNMNLLGKQEDEINKIYIPNEEASQTGTMKERKRTVVGSRRHRECVCGCVCNRYDGGCVYVYIKV